MIERFLRWIDTISDGDDTVVLTIVADIVVVLGIILLFTKNF